MSTLTGKCWRQHALLEDMATSSNMAFCPLASYMHHCEACGQASPSSARMLGCWRDVGICQDQECSIQGLAAMAGPSYGLCWGTDPACRPWRVWQEPKELLSVCRYYPLNMTYFKSGLDSHMLDLLWNKYWVNTLSSSPLLGTRDLTAGQIADIGEPCAEASFGVSI